MSPSRPSLISDGLDSRQRTTAHFSKGSVQGPRPSTRHAHDDTRTRCRERTGGRGGQACGPLSTALLGDMAKRSLSPFLSGPSHFDPLPGRTAGWSCTAQVTGGQPTDNRSSLANGPKEVSGGACTSFLRLRGSTARWGCSIHHNPPGEMIG